MDYLMFIDQTNRHLRTPCPIQYLVSGCDRRIRDTILQNLLRQVQQSGRSLIIIGDGENGELDTVRSMGFRLNNGLTGEYFLFNPFRKISSMTGLSRLRQLLAAMEYDEKQKGKLCSYLSFIRHMEHLRTGSHELDLTLDKIAEYCTVSAVEEILQDLEQDGRISQHQRMTYLAKYAECAAAGADFEDMFFLLMPFSREQGRRLGTEPGTAVFFPLGEDLGEDTAMRNLVLKLLQFGLEDPAMCDTTVLVFDRGYGNRAGVAQLLNTLAPHIDLHVFSQDIFTLCGRETLAMILNRFPARVYSRHQTIASAREIEQDCGEIEVIKKTYNVTYDRRWQANRPLDILLGTNKTENFGEAVPVKEPLYPKEMILQLAPGTGIVQYRGNSTIFSI